MNLNNTSIATLIFYILILKNTNKISSILMICFIEYVHHCVDCINE